MDFCSDTNITLTYTAADNCTNDTVTATFKVDKAEDVMVLAPENIRNRTSCKFADQAALTAAYTEWINSFMVDPNNDGCNAVGRFTNTPPTDIDYCTGGNVQVTYTATDGCTTATVFRVFIVRPVPPVVVNTPDNVTVSACDMDIQAQFDLFVSGFTANGGCAVVGSFDSTPVMPELCGGSVTVDYSVEDKCFSGDYSATFTITPAPAVDVDFPSSMSISACDDVQTAFDIFKADFSLDADSGCAPTAEWVGPSTLSDDILCGGSQELVYSVTDKCFETKEYKATFTITPAPAVVIAMVDDYTTTACDTQDEVDAQFATFLSSFGVSGGCSPDGNFAAEYSAPDACTGGSVTVVYNVTDKCYDGGSESATFMVPAAVQPTVSFPGNATASACDSDIEAQFEAFINAFSYSGDCGASGSFETTPVLPNLCGGSVMVNFQVRNNCFENKDYKATFTITPADAVVIATVADYTADACDTQAEVDAQFATFLASFGVSGGCSPMGSDLTGYTAPDACTGGRVEVVYNVTDKCYEGGSEVAVFTVPAATSISISDVANLTVDACDYEDQDALNSAFMAFYDSFTYAFEGTCTITETITDDYTIPVLCDGGSVTINYSVSNGCETKTDTAIFTVTPPAAVVVKTAGMVTVEACDNLQAEFDFFKSLFGVQSGGCNPTGVFVGESTLPADISCGGSITLTYRVTDLCYAQTDFTAIFVVNPPAAFEAPEDDSMTVECEAAAIAPTMPVVYNACNEVITPSGPVRGGTYEGCEGTITYTYSYVDCAGNNAEWVYTYNVEITNGPDAGTDGSAALLCGDDAIEPMGPTVYDACGVEITPTVVRNDSNFNGCSGTIVYTFTYTDCAGNSDDYVFTYTIADTVAPIITTEESIIELDCNYNFVIANMYPSFEVTDNCTTDITPIITPDEAITEYNEGGCIVCEFTYTANAQDVCLNGAAPVTVTYIWRMDKVAPTISVPTDLQVLELDCTEDVPTVASQLALLNVDDNCAESLGLTVVLDNEQRVDGENGAYTLTRTYRATDCGRNTATTTQIINVSCDNVPTIAAESNGLSISAYPVPFSNEVTIAYDFNFNTPVSIEIYDTKGALIMKRSNLYHKVGAKDKVKFDLSNVADQMLLVQVKTQNGTVTKKIVKSDRSR
ncbi:Por secretion system C-terminal sorting domain-containing protein [Flavobacteriaceae bacterium MAR_2010_188]|nr:Por secretion system C-terminal sorting domain-containing protein [Flavobacteriaceae bacterium MAR_2010_188]